MSSAKNLLLIIAALFFPPITAAWLSGCGADLLINIGLTILGFFPGTIHALWLLYHRMKAEKKWGVGGYRYLGNGTYEGFPVLSGAPLQAQVPVAYGSTTH